MKPLLTLLVLAVAFLASGCANRIVDASSTKLAVSASPMGRDVEVQLPKNLDGEEIEFTFHPETGVYKFKAKKLKADASGVIDSAGAAQAQALAEMAATLRTIAPLLIPAPPAN